MVAGGHVHFAPPPAAMATAILFILNTITRTSACSLCLNGEIISNPAKRIDLTQPVPLATCLDLSNILAFVDETSDLCLQARSLSSLCGCPARRDTTNTTTTTCTVCAEGSNMTLPLQVLDGLLELPMSGASFGLTTTCEILESAINQYEHNEQRCLDLPFDDLRQYCACSSNTDDDEAPAEEADSTTACNFCVGGEQLVEISDSSFVFQGALISCLDAAELVRTTEKNSDNCRALQSAGTICGCPVPSNGCELCRGGVLGDPNREIVLANGDVTACNVLEASLQLLDEGSLECSLKDQYAAECGCTAALEFQPCTLCPLGEEVPNPERNISGIEGLGYDYIEHNCGILADAASNTDLNSDFCKSTQLLGKLCGCAVKKNACSICGDGNSLTKPLATSIWAVGKTEAEMDIAFDVNGLFSCEIVDSTFSALYQTDDDYCYYIHLTKGVGCGCEGTGNNQVIALIWTQRFSGFLSLLGSMCIIFFIIAQPTPKKRWSMFHQLMFGISVFDSLSSLGFILGTLPAPENTALYNARGTEATCSFQGWMLQAGQVSMYYNVALSMYFLLVIKYSWTDRRLQKIRRYVHTGLLLVGFILAGSSIPFHEPDYRWCYVAWPPIGASYVPGLVFFVVPVGLCIAAITILTVHLVLYVQQVNRKSSASSLSNTCASTSMASRTFWQSLWFLAAFYLVWPVMLLTFIMPQAADKFWWLLVGAALGPLQGFFNALIFFNRRRKSIILKLRAMLWGARPEQNAPSTASTGANQEEDQTLSHKNIAEQGEGPLQRQESSFSIPLPDDAASTITGPTAQSDEGCSRGNDTGERGLVTGPQEEGKVSFSAIEEHARSAGLDFEGNE